VGAGGVEVGDTVADGVLDDGAGGVPIRVAGWSLDGGETVVTMVPLVGIDGVSAEAGPANSR